MIADPGYRLEAGAPVVVECPAGSTGEGVPFGCIATEPFLGTVSPSVGDPFYAVDGVDGGECPYIDLNKTIEKPT